MDRAGDWHHSTHERDRAAPGVPERIGTAPARDDANTHDAIVEQYPAPGGRALRQTEVGATLELGYDGRLVVNGIAIPEEQMEGALDPDDPVNKSNIEEFGLRMNNRHRVVFRPGPGKVIEAFEQGEIQITLQYFPAGRQETDSRTTSWTASVS